MREEFEGNLRKYHEIAKVMEGEPNNLQLQKELISLQRQASLETGSRPEGQPRVFRLQQEKQRIMHGLKEKLANLDDPKYEFNQEDGTQLVSGHEGELFIAKQDGSEAKITKGELLTDGDWGNKYSLDESVPRSTHKRYLVEEARRELQNRVDRQILIYEMGRTRKQGVRGAYQEVLDKREKGVESMGLVAEKMAENFLKKLSYDYPETNFEIIKADVFQDMALKVDFIIHRKMRNRGVQVKAVGGKTYDQGIQFTVNTDRQSIQRKMKQVEEARGKLPESESIDDIVLVSLPMKDFAYAYREWQETKSSGGPDKPWPAETKEKIFKNVMKGFLEPKEIEEQWRIIAGQGDASAQDAEETKYREPVAA